MYIILAVIAQYHMMATCFYIAFMEARLSRCSFCAQPPSDTEARRRNLSSLLHGGSIVGSFVRTVWPALWHQLTVSTQTACACLRCFQDLDTGSKRLEALSQSIYKLEGSFSSSEYYSLAVRTTTIFTQPFDSYPKSLAMALCMRNGSTVSLTQRKLHLRRSHPTHAHVTDM